MKKKEEKPKVEKSSLTNFEKDLMEKIKASSWRNILLTEEDNDDIERLFGKLIWDHECVDHFSVKKKTEILKNLFLSSTSNLVRRKRENEEINRLGRGLFRYSQELCDIHIPEVIVDEILSFAQCDKDLLNGFGLTSKSSYYSVLLNWLSIRITEYSKFSIPILVLRNAKSIEFGNSYSHRCNIFGRTTIDLDKMKYHLYHIFHRKLTKNIRYRKIESLNLQNNSKVFFSLIKKNNNPVFSKITSFESMISLESSVNLNEYFPLLEKVNIRNIEPTRNCTKIADLSLFKGNGDQYSGEDSLKLPENLFVDYPYFKNLKKLQFYPQDNRMFDKISNTLENVSVLQFAIGKDFEEQLVFPFRCISDKKKFAKNLQELKVEGERYGRRGREFIFHINSSIYSFERLKKLSIECKITSSTLTSIPKLPNLTELSLPRLTCRDYTTKTVTKLFQSLIISGKEFRHNKILLDFSFYNQSVNNNCMSFNFEYSKHSLECYFQIMLVMQDGRHEYDGPFYLYKGDEEFTFFEDIFGNYFPREAERPIVVKFCDIKRDGPGLGYFEKWKNERKNVKYLECDVYGNDLNAKETSSDSDSDSGDYEDVIN